MVSPFHVIIWKRIDCFIEMWRRSVSTEVKMNFVVELNAWYRKIIHRRRVSILYSPALVTMGILEPLHRRTWQFSVFCLVVEFKCVFWLIHPCDRQTDRQTELPWHYTRYSIYAVAHKKLLYFTHLLGSCLWRNHLWQIFSNVKGGRICQGRKSMALTGNSPLILCCFYRAKNVYHHI